MECNYTTLAELGGGGGGGGGEGRTGCTGMAGEPAIGRSRVGVAPHD